MMFGSVPASKALIHEGDGWHYQGLQISEFSREEILATFLDDEKVRGIVFLLPLGMGVIQLRWSERWVWKTHCLVFFSFLISKGYL